MQVRAIAVDLAAEYRATAAAGGAAAGGGSPEGASATGTTKEALAFELNRSGRYLVLKKAIKSAVVAIARERAAAAAIGDRHKGKKEATSSILKVGKGETAAGGKESAEAARDETSLHNELYCLLADELRAALSGLSAAAIPAVQQLQASAISARLQSCKQQQQAPAGERLGEDQQRLHQASSTAMCSKERLLALALESEEEGDCTRAHVLHQQRVTAAGEVEDVRALSNYGRFCLRIGNRDRAEDCLRRALEIDAHSTSAAAALLCLQLLAAREAAGDSRKAQLFEAAEALGHALKDASAAEAAAGEALPWALLAMVCKEQGRCWCWFFAAD